MPPKAAGRRRKRQRRRQDLPELSSSDSDESSSSGSDAVPTKDKGKAKAVEPPSVVAAATVEQTSDDSSDSDASSSDSDESPSSSSSSSSSSSEDAGTTAKRGRLAKKQKIAVTEAAAPNAAVAPRRGPSPPAIPHSPTLAPLASFPTRPASHTYRPTFGLGSSSQPPSQPPPTEESLAFRSWYMDSLVSRFSSELDGLRKDPEMAKTHGKTRFAVLVEALASGADLFDEKGEWGARREVPIDLRRRPKKGKEREIGGDKGLVLEALAMKAEPPTDGGESMRVDGAEEEEDDDAASDFESAQDDVEQGAGMDAMEGLERSGDVGSGSESESEEDSDEEEAEDGEEMQSDD